MSGAAFLAVGALLYGLRREQRAAANLGLSDLAGAATRYPLLALALSVAVLGLAGLPPLAGFMSKWMIFTSGFETRDIAIIMLVVLGAANSVLSLGYYAPIVTAVFRQQPSALVRYGGSIPTSMLLGPLLLGLAIVALGVWPGLAAGLVQPAAAAIVRGFGG
jgi:NADH:ubiquinone oxidoreductase subunit 2 (subunit N)